MTQYHVPVLRDDAVTKLQMKENRWYIDGTVGGGGHFRQMLHTINEGVFIGIDVDEDAIKENINALLQLGIQCEYEEDGLYYFKDERKSIFLIKENFSKLSIIVEKVEKIMKTNSCVEGILLDLGVSSYQIDVPEKGFSYMRNGPLDMRMDKRLTVKAEDLINGLYQKELEDVLRGFGEEVYAHRIAKAIVTERKKGSITEAFQLKEVIKKNVPSMYRNPYAKTFQALRIAVNSELENIAQVCNEIDTVLKKDGNVVVISFHSLEDRIIKKHFLHNPQYEVMNEFKKPNEEEVDNNKRARSAIMRCFKKII